MTAIPQGLTDSLFAPAPHRSLGRHADTYGRVIGSWVGEFHDQPVLGQAARGPMEVHFGWALQGMAVIDTWISPDREARAKGLASPRKTYGSTIRVFDPEAEAWRVTWTNPETQMVCALVGRRVGDDIVQTGYWNDRPQRWRFCDIKPGSFIWQAHSLDDDGAGWTLQTEFRLRRA